ncbi:MAG: hypothetical protein FWF49_05575, partial [Oscillospiraceae bacterium]|nr:hypothetical protein [Oscillospiraceae bacterium]
MIEKEEKQDTFMADKNEFFTYKGRPLVRQGNTLYYGNMFDECVVMMQILTSHEENGLKVADRIQLQL